MRARLFALESKSPALPGVLTLGNISKLVPRAKISNGSGYFLYFKLNDHPDLVEEGARLIAERIKSLGLKHPCFVTPEASTIALAHVLRVKYGIDGLVVYKNKQINDIAPVCVEYDCVTSKDKKQLFIGSNKAATLEGKDIVILDSVCTSGGTIRATYDLLLKAGIPACRIIEATVLFTEGSTRDSLTVSPGVALTVHGFSHLPIIQEVEASELRLV